jgi:multidrug resistance protein
MKKPSPLALLVFIMVVNALSYATIIPLLYTYSARFGITPLGMSMLFTSYSLAQFLATPILGRLSDRFGRKPILTLCLIGTGLSLGMFAMAKTALMLFVARMIDGVTGGNISIAQAIISDTTSGENRAKSFGMLGAAFGIGFLFGPLLGGALGQFGETMPFWISAALAMLSAILCHFTLPETLKPSDQSAQKHEPLFNFGALFQALFQPYVGIVLMVSFVAASALNAMILGFQTYTVDILKLTPLQIGLFFSSFGLIGVLMQVFGIGPVLKRVQSKKKLLTFSLVASGVSLVAAFLAQDAMMFFIAMTTMGIVGAFRDPMISALISERTNSEDQGVAMGINQSYMSLGQIVGPIAAGLVTTYSIRYVFLLAGVLMVVAGLATRNLYIKHKPVDF